MDNCDFRNNSNLENPENNMHNDYLWNLRFSNRHIVFGLYSSDIVSAVAYRDLEKQLRREFEVSLYKAIHRNQTDTALEIIANYELPLCLKEQIHDENAQMNI